MESNFQKSYSILYSNHLVDVADVQPTHQAHPADPPPQPATDDTLENDGFVLIQLDQLLSVDDCVQLAPANHHRFCQQVPLLSAAHPAHQPHPAHPVLQFEPATQLFQFLAIFAVPVRVNVPQQYIAYPSGFNIIPVLTVRLL